MLYPHLESDLIRLKKINRSRLSNKELLDYLGHRPSNKLKEWKFLEPCLNSKGYGTLWIVEIPEHIDLIEFIDQKRRELINVKAQCARKSSSHKKWSDQSLYYCSSKVN